MAKRNFKSNDKKWIVVTYHHPVFSASTGRDNPEIRSLWQPIFEEYNIDLALQGMIIPMLGELFTKNLLLLKKIMMVIT